jgi:hypothetical protein
LGKNVERSFNIETEVFAELSFHWLLLPFILIDNVELLVDFPMLVVDNDVLVLSIEASRNIHNLSFLINDEGTIMREHLPPSGIDTRGKSEVA